MRLKVSKIIRMLTDKHYRFLKFAEIGIYNKLSDDEYIKRKFRAEMGYDLDLDCPKTYNEKLQWLKLYDRKSLYSQMVDKYEVKKYVAEKIGEKYIIPTYGVWDNFDDIDFAQLPNKFVLKCTHDSGGLVICRDKRELNIDGARRRINRCLKKNFFLCGREWPYKNVTPRIIAEKYVEDKKSGELRDYKFFCFNGEPKIMFIASDRQKKSEEVKFDFYDMDFNHLPIRNGHPLAKLKPEKPIRFNEMKNLASQLSQSIPQLRVDFYEVNGDIFFGELTFFQHSGFCPIEPKEWDVRMGDWINIDIIKN